MQHLQDQYQGFLQTPNLFRKAYDGLEFFSLNVASEGLQELPDGFEISEKLRLGQRVEYFMEAALEYAEYEILSKNLQIVENKQTLGELDFLLRNKADDQYVHLEMMYKFYFYDHEIAGPWTARWIGDNRRDSMQKKLRKLKTKQLPMLYRDATQKELRSLGLKAEQFDQEILAKGQLYLPYGEKYQNDYINAQAIAGYWIRFEELKAIRAQIHQIHLPYKNNWIISPRESGYEWDTFEAMLPKLSWRISENISSLLWIQTTVGTLERLFLLSW